MSKCSGIVDGFNPKSVNAGLETKIDQELSKAQVAEREEDAFLKDIGIAGGVNAKKEWQYNRKKELPNYKDRFEQKEELIPHAQEFYHTVAATKTGTGASTKIDNEVYEQARTKYRSYVDKLLPIQEIGRILNVPTFEEIAMGVDKKVRKGLFVNDRKEKKNKHFTYVPNGAIVESRLDITAYQYYDIWAVTLTSKTGKAFNGSKYGRAARLTNVTFPITDSQKLGAIKIAITGPYGGVPKNPYAVMKGGFVNTPVKDMEAMMEEAFNSPDWVEIGVNPFRDPEFYRKDTGERIKGADEIIQIGPVVMAKNVYGSDRTKNNKPTRSNPFKFAYTQDIFTALDNGEFIIANNYAYRKQHNYQRKGDTYVQPYSIYDKKSKQKIGWVEIEQVQEGDSIDVKDRVTGIINIQLDESARGNNAGTKIVQSIMAMSPETKSFRIASIKDDAIGFWKKLGTNITETNRGTKEGRITF